MRLASRATWIRDCRCSAIRSSSSNVDATAKGDEKLKLVYEGAMTKSVTYLKRVSAATFFATICATPLTVFVQNQSPLVVAMLFSSAILTSGLSTLAVNWACNPYVCRLYKHAASSIDSSPIVTAVTLTFFGREVATTLPASSLTGAARAFATWKLKPLALDDEAPSPEQIQAGKTVLAGSSSPMYNRKYFYVHQDNENSSNEFREIVGLVNGGGKRATSAQSWDDVVKNLKKT
ncbi:hypothetical protein SmJEL517_g06113 [Synchytrium microbalum]|uniref:Transmembrane protein 186 n=1 Tax=Synchytrium microbalum TaxID=1806994 RepID=A0A507BHD1_9FUNG|nr:uncharacterized protein SmJEL517_g06113 [Synchytrium microbalum]TPX30300.1 hypothetical protein SmJEL517_g06113 [Synchytrium microbalum]